MSDKNTKRQINLGFTIVELLIVIVIVGVLTAITIVSYAGITIRANQTSLQSDLVNASKQLKMYQAINNAYPIANNCPTPGANEICLKNNSDTSYLYSVNNDSNPQTFSLYATKGTIRYRVTNDSSPTPASQVVASGGTVTNVGGYRIHTFTASGTFTVTSGDNVEALVVAGGGGGRSGGGGAGGLIYNTSNSVITQAYAVTVGNGGAGCPARGGVGCTNGQNSSFNNLISLGGGYGGYNDSYHSASSGGSGGGGGATSTVQDNGGAGTVGQGYDGGTVGPLYFFTPYPTGGGGGAGAPGGAPVNNTTSGNGGVGLQYSISGVNTYYAGGGGGANWNGGNHGIGGNGGGGGGGLNGISGAANSGGGGGGARADYIGGNGGSGIVIIRYPN